jgi:hypothetical protein
MKAFNTCPLVADDCYNNRSNTVIVTTRLGYDICGLKYYQMNKDQIEMLFWIIGTFLGTMLLLALIVYLA